MDLRELTNKLIDDIIDTQDSLIDKMKELKGVLEDRRSETQNEDRYEVYDDKIKELEPIIEKFKLIGIDELFKGEIV